MEILGMLVAALILTCMLTFVVEGCKQPQVVKADTGEIVQESNKLQKVVEYDVAGDDNDFDVVELKRGDITYLVFVDYQTGMHVINYTMDSLEVSFQKEHLDKTPQTGFLTDGDELMRSTKNTNSWSSR